jgi:hypothetical protein
MEPGMQKPSLKLKIPSFSRLDTFMLLKWDAETINTAMDTLEPLERTALQLKTELQDCQNIPGIKRLAKYGFMNPQQYLDFVESGTAKFKAYFAFHGVHHVSDLAFEERESSSDGHLRDRLRKDNDTLLQDVVQTAV